MKHLKTYEGFLSHLKGKSKEQIISDLKKSDKDIYEIFDLAEEYGLELKISDLYNQDEINNLSKNQKNKIIYYCILNYDYESLPRNEKGEIFYDGNLYCNNINLKELPDNLKVNGVFDCSRNNLTKLPDNLIVNDRLECSFNELTKLPDNLTVNGYLICSNQKSGIKLELPETSVVKGRFVNT